MSTTNQLQFHIHAFLLLRCKRPLGFNQRLHPSLIITGMHCPMGDNTIALQQTSMSLFKSSIHPMSLSDFMSITDGKALHLCQARQEDHLLPSSSDDARISHSRPSEYHGVHHHFLPLPWPENRCCALAISWKWWALAWCLRFVPTIVPVLLSLFGLRPDIPHEESLLCATHSIV
ncbi:hypothetical protein EV421DRAFT_1812290 [Armillaria borealis]|uniref:Uncharacterized protein n=1 Tax=Armillaria borealis TaxID=47425 RepID=A0AA39JI18_9AGAR|nr:hypothetical protein EV421DRAFT_1812290 [Armillaria borealis]